VQRYFEDIALSELKFEELRPNDLFMFARQRLAEGERDLAREAFEKVVQMAPQHFQALTLLGSLSYQVGDDLQAEAYVDRAIELTQAAAARRPRDMGLRASLANLLTTRGRREEAEQIVREVDLPIYPVRSTQEEFEARIADATARGLPSILINTVPKSASESIWNRLAEGLGLAQGHISVFLYPDCSVVPSRAAFAARGGLIAKEHLRASEHNLSILAEHDFRRIVFHLRDPRQVIVSWAHFVRDDVSMRLMGPLWRKVVPPHAVLTADLPTLLDWCIDHFLPQLLEFVDGWRKVAADDASPFQVRFLSFERFLDDPQGYFDETLAFLEIDPARFRAEAETESVHLRKGEKEEWRAVLSKDQKARAWKQIPAELAEEQGWRK
jgi:tetratricopeptide (TPR) repeat protein